MKFKPGGRKIYRTREKNQYSKTTFGKVVSVALMGLFLVGICFLGYSAASSIFDFDRKVGDSEIVATTTEDTSVNTENTEDTTADNPNALPLSNNYYCIMLNNDDMKDINSLRSALASGQLSTGVTHIMVPLKIKGGELLYASSVMGAFNAGAVKSEVKLSEITAEINSAGYKAIAYVNVLDDNLFPVKYPNAGYKSGNSLWLNGDGKPQLSPFTSECGQYIGALMHEISFADFEQVIIGGMKIYVSDEVIPEEGYMNRASGLTYLANEINSTVSSNNSKAVLEVSAVDLLNEKLDFLPVGLNITTWAVNIGLKEIGDVIVSGGMTYDLTGTPAEKTSKVLEIIKTKVGDVNIVVRITDGNTAELISAKSAADNYPCIIG